MLNLISSNNPWDAFSSSTTHFSVLLGRLTLQCRVLFSLTWQPPSIRNWTTKRIPEGYVLSDSHLHFLLFMRARAPAEAQNSRKFNSDFISVCLFLCIFSVVFACFMWEPKAKDHGPSVLSHEPEFCVSFSLSYSFQIHCFGKRHTYCNQQMTSLPGNLGTSLASCSTLLLNRTREIRSSCKKSSTFIEQAVYYFAAFDLLPLSSWMVPPLPPVVDGDGGSEVPWPNGPHIGRASEMWGESGKMSRFIPQHKMEWHIIRGGLEMRGDSGNSMPSLLPQTEWHWGKVQKCKGTLANCPVPLSYPHPIRGVWK